MSYVKLELMVKFKDTSSTLFFFLFFYSFSFINFVIANEFNILTKLYTNIRDLYAYKNTFVDFQHL